MSISSTAAADGSVVTIAITGRFDFSWHEEFRAAYEPADAQKTYVLDMQEAEYMDSSALGMVLLMREQVGGDHAKIRIINCRPQLKSILNVANFSRLFDVA